MLRAHLRPLSLIAHLSALCLYSSVALAIAPNPRQSTNAREIRVLLGNFARINISGLDLILSDGSSLAGNSAFNIHCGSKKNGESFIEYAAQKKPLNQLDIISPSGFLHLNGKLYRSKITIISNGEKCAVINTLDLEKYLAGLLTKEMHSSWPMEALKAQAVASRSYALAQAENNRGKTYDLENTTQDQVYDGAQSETQKSNQAVYETKGSILSFGAGPIKAYFHANCGGMTETPEFVWGSANESFRPVACPYHKQARDKKDWTLILTKTQIQNALQKISGILPTSFLKMAQLEAGAPNPNQRLNDVVVSDVRGNSFVIAANAFRNALGNTKLKSTSFHIVALGDSYKIIGQGFGHGVGLCQIGARAMAKEGKKYQEILRYYYPLAKILRLY